MVHIVQYSEIASLGRLKCRGEEAIEWEGIRVETVKFSLRKSSLIERIIDIFIIALVGLITLGAALEFPYFIQLWKSAFKGRKILFYVDKNSVPENFGFFSNLLNMFIP